MAGFPAARNFKTGRAWLTHCYGTVALARDNAPDTGNGAELYAVIGSARRLDRNLTVIGRVVQGMEILAVTPRGDAALGFYSKASDNAPVRMRLGSALQASEQVSLQALRTDSATFAKVVEGRRNRRDAFYATPPGGVDVYNVPLPVRPSASALGTTDAPQRARSEGKWRSRPSCAMVKRGRSRQIVEGVRMRLISPSRYALIGLACAALPGIAGASAPGTIATFTAIGTDPNYAWTQTPHQNDGALIPRCGSRRRKRSRSNSLPTASPTTTYETIQALAAFGQLPAEMVVSGPESVDDFNFNGIGPAIPFCRNARSR